MTYHIAVCDDDTTAAAYIQTLVSDWAFQNEHTVRIRCFPSAEAFLFYYDEDNSFDILLLDIEMGGQNGVELARKIRKTNETVQIIFITGYPDFIAEGYEVSALHYLLKPVNESKLKETLSRALKNLRRQSHKLTLTVNEETIRISVSEILYIESANHSIEVVTTDGVYSVKIPLYEIEEQLSSQFVRIHRCYLVNLEFIKKISRTEVVLDSGLSLPLSRRLYAQVNRTFLTYLKGGTDS